MKRSLLLTAALAAAALLLRLPHPSRDISKLLPVQTLYLYMEEDLLCVETDTGDRGSGGTLASAAENLKSAAPGEIFLDTAQFLILGPDVPITEEFYDLLRPGCRVVYAAEQPDLQEATEYLINHKPKLTLSQLRAEAGAM